MESKKIKCHICKTLINEDNRFFNYLCIGCATRALSSIEKLMDEIKKENKKNGRKKTEIRSRQ